MTERGDVTFKSMGSDVRVLVEAPEGSGLPPVGEAIQREREFLEQFAARLTRFDPSSELSPLNADRRSAVPASRLLRAAVSAGLWAAERSKGLVDPTLLGALEGAGYRESRAGMPPASLAEALAQAPGRRAAAPDPAARWRSIEVDDRAGVVRRPPGVRVRHGGCRQGAGRRRRACTGSPATRGWSSTAVATSRCAANGRSRSSIP